ncbi:hypothetical protein FRC0505_02480 [Corynebacterium diphtheriae]|nr:hypothetical protein FRC0505_02480 [Corynebacterium diphtheriae]
MMHASKYSGLNAPPRAMTSLPDEPSSAGVPMYFTVHLKEYVFLRTSAASAR